MVWASWSPRSRDIAERVSALAGRWGSRARVVTVELPGGPPGGRALPGRQELRRPGLPRPDGAFSRKYNVATLPGLVVVKDGQVAYHGKLPDDADQVLGGLLH